MSIIKDGFKAVFSRRSGKVWFITTAALLVLIIAVNIILTQVTLIFGTFNIMFGGYRYELSGDFNNPGYQRFVSDYDDKAGALAAANNFIEEVLDEGITLLKNDDVLPIRTPKSPDAAAAKPKISVFGKNSVNLVYGGSGSGGRSDKAEPSKTLYESLDAAGFEYNPDLVSFYNSSASGQGRPANPGFDAGAIPGLLTGETPYSSYSEPLKASYAQYNAAALVVISRMGGEGFDLPRTMKKSNGDPLESARQTVREDYIEYHKDDHYLQLDQNEIDLLKAVGNAFDKVILILNSATSMELGFLDDEQAPGYHKNIKGALWIATTGGTGAMAIGRVLNGQVNPSGRTVDIYARNFKNDPTWNNFSTNLTEKGDQYYLIGTQQKDSNQTATFVRYEEGIYIGYRYYETRSKTERDKDPINGQFWYGGNVVFPFGYGKSYTTFDWTAGMSSPAANSTLTKSFVTNKDSKIVIPVTVTNTGNYPGKDVVEIYATAPYYINGIEKAHKVLAGFKKTPMLYPVSQAGSGKPNSATVEVEIDPYALASYDYLGINSTGKSGYILERGDYQLWISKNSHEEVAAITYNIASDIFFEKDTVTGYAVENKFDDVSDEIEIYLSRADWNGTWPKTPQNREYGAKEQAWFDKFFDYSADISYDIGKPWYTLAAQMPEYQSRALGKGATEIKLYEMIGKNYDDPLWEKFINQLSVSQMAELIGQGAFQSITINNIIKPECLDYDGPAGFNLFMTTVPDVNVAYYPSECIIAATWNADLAYKMGQIVGNESLWGRKEGNYIRPYSGWYAPAINLHRTPFSGRNFEYYSEDAYLSGIMAGNVCSGAQSKGVYTFIKHFAVND